MTTNFQGLRHQSKSGGPIVGHQSKSGGGSFFKPCITSIIVKISDPKKLIRTSVTLMYSLTINTASKLSYSYLFVHM